MYLFELTQAANDGIPEAQYVLGLLYQNGLGCQSDKDKAVKWYSRAAEQGFAAAQYSLGALLYDAHTLTDGTFEELIVDLKKSIRTKEWGGNPAAAFRLFLIAAKKDFWPAQDAVAGAYELGYGTPDNSRRAFLWAKKAADAGYIRAAMRIASMFDEGRGTAVDGRQALHYYKQAANQGDSLAAYLIAGIYKRSKPSRKNHSQIISWLIKAADLNYIGAHFDLYSVYSKGLYGEPINHEKARQHERRANELTEALKAPDASPLD
jgi:TPR repeat protein